MNQYSQIRTHFQDAKALGREFRIFLRENEFSGSTGSLQAAFAVWRIIAFDDTSTLSWDDLLRQRRNAGYPVLAYALAGNISEERYVWLLQTLTAETIRTYTDLDYSLIVIAAAFGHVRRLELLLEVYVSTEEELKQALFFAVYYGHRDMFNFLLTKINEQRAVRQEPELEISTLTDNANDQNTLLHVAVMGHQREMVKFLLSLSSVNVEATNAQQHRAIDKVILSDNMALLSEFERVYLNPISRLTIRYEALVLLLARSSSFSDEHQVMLDYLRRQCPNDHDQLRSFMQGAIDANNDRFVQKFLDERLSHEEVDSLVKYAKTKDSTVSSLGEEKLFRDWMTAVIDDVLERLSVYIGAYIDRDQKQLAELAKQDGVLHYSSSTITVFIDNKRKARLQEDCKEILQNLWNSHYRELKAIYNAATTEEKKSTAQFIKKIQFNRAVLIGFIKSEKEDKRNPDAFKQQILQALRREKLEQQEEMSEADDVSLSGSAVVGVAEETQSQNDSQDSGFTEKMLSFIDVFVEEFDKTYHFYLCVSGGDLVSKTDGVVKLAEVAKTAAKILPDGQLSAATLGIPLPFAIKFPSSVAVAAVIDICLWIRERDQQREAGRVTDFFKGKRLRLRTDIIYNCAESMAMRFRDQIEVLSTTEEGVPYFAKMAVAKVFRYIMQSNVNVQADSPSFLGTLFRKVVSNVMATPPEPERVTKSLNEVVHDAVSTHDHLLLCQDQFESLELQLDRKWDANILEAERKHQKTNSEISIYQWTVKGIFEHTGVHTSDGSVYAYSEEDVKKYGYTYVDVKSEDMPGKIPRLPTSPTPWFRPTYDLSQRSARSNSSSASASPVKTTARRSGVGAWFSFSSSGETSRSSSAKNSGAPSPSKKPS